MTMARRKRPLPLILIDNIPQNESDRFPYFHTFATQKKRYRFPSLANYQEYQRLYAKYGNYLVDGILLGPDATRVFGVLRSDCKAIAGKKPKMCPQSAPKLSPGLLPQIEA